MKRRSQPLLILIGAIAFVGCAELITYSGKSIEKGDALAAEGRTEEAAGAYRNATQQNPRSYQGFYKLGETYSKLGREQQALQSYHAAVDVMPDPGSTPDEKAFHEQAVNGLAACIAKSSSRDAEIAAANEKATRTGKSLDWYVVARTYAVSGDADNAIIAYDKAVIASDSRDFAILKSFGLYLAQVDQTKRAEATLTKAYQLKADDEEVLAALRKLGVVPGPSLLDESQLHRPLIPRGPIPELELKKKEAPDASATPPQ